ncbi:MAG TPA: LysR substrate-binding domain-containing protein, partial [Holophaga sp.]|nr:LysR substrate-binding domain-containing protein [Holophaga sp.]
LEECLGVGLFTRTQHGLALTKSGQLYLDCIRPILAKLVEAGEMVARQQARPRNLQVRLPPSFADRWLLSLYPEFRAQHPDMDIQFTASPLPVDASMFTYDAYVSLGNGTWPGCVADYVCGKELILVAGRRLFERNPPIQSPAGILDFDLFEHREVPGVWSQAFGILGLQPGKSVRISQWDFYSVIIRSVSLGHGLALLPRCYIREEIDSGELVQVLDHHQYSPYGYYFIIPAGRQADASIVRFRDWLRTKRSDGELPPPEEG